MIDVAAGPTAWAVTSASEKGSSHDDATPNQDAAGSRTVELPSGPAVVAAVADGHGGKQYVRSAEGAGIAVELALDELVRTLRANTAPDLRAGLEAVARTVVTRWRARVVADHAGRPFTREERIRAGADLDRDPVVAYGATLLLAVVQDHVVGLAQLGDGDAIVRAGGRTTVPVPGDARLVASQTTSLCLATAAADFRYAVVDAADADLVLVTTDGYGNSFAADDWREQVADDMAALVRSAGVSELASKLPSWLAESARVGGDDVTAVVVVRAGGPAAAAVPAIASPQVTGAAGLRRRPVVAAVVAAAVLAAAVLTVLLVSGDDDPAPAPSVSPSPQRTVVPTTPAETPDQVPPGQQPGPSSFSPAASLFTAPVTSATPPTTRTTGPPVLGGSSAAPQL